MTIATKKAFEATAESFVKAGMMTDEEKGRIIAAIDGGTKEAPPELWTRRQVAEMIKKTPQMVDNYARRGFIRRVRLGNSSRASGFDAESVRAFINGGKQEGCHAGN